MGPRRKRVLVGVVLAGLFGLPFSAGAAEPPITPILKIDLGAHSSMIKKASIDSAERFVLTCSTDKTGRLWDAATGRLLQTYRVPSGTSTYEGMLYSCALSPDGAIAAMGGWTGYEWDGSNSIYLFDRRSGQMLRRLSGLTGTVNDLEFTSDGAYLVSGHGGSGGVNVWRCSDWTKAGSDPSAGGATYGVDTILSGGSTLVASVSYDRKVRLYRIGGTLEKLSEYETGSDTEPICAAFAPDGNALAVGYHHAAALEVVSITSGKLAKGFTPDLAGISGGDFSSIAYSQDGNVLFAAGRDGSGRVRRWAAAGRGERSDIRPGNRETVGDLAGLGGGALLVSAADPFWAILDSAGNARAASKSSTADMRGGMPRFRLDAGGLAVSFGFAGNGGDPVIFDTVSRSLKPGAAPENWKAPDSKSITVKNWDDRFDPTIDGKALPLGKGEMSRSLAVAPGGDRFVLGCEWDLYAFDREGKKLWENKTSGIAWRVNVSDDGKLAVAGFSDGTVRWFRMSDGRELLALFAHPDKKRWVLWTPSGYYDASPGGEDLIGWHLNNGKNGAADFFPAARFRTTYYRPDVVGFALPTLDEQRALAMANEGAGRKAAAGSIMEKRPPIVSITTPDQNSGFSSAKVRVGYRVRTPDDAPVTSVRALIDGRPAEGARGLTVTAAANAEPSLEIPLPERDCIVSLIAENKNGPSEAASVSLKWTGAKAAPADEFTIKPKLYLLSVGVSAYEKKDYRLAYAAKDARDFGDAFRSQNGGLYREVVTKVLTDAQANKDDILDALDWIQKQTTAKDIAVIFFAGHGINDSNGNYYFLPMEADVDRLKRTGVPFSDIRTTVSGISGKVLFFIDTCHSGNLMAGRRAAAADRDIIGVINELSSAENGAVVFASSTGSQYSYEDPKWGNGAFTKALIEGLGGKASYAGNGRVTVNMLDLYLSERVKELTGGKQTPATTKPANVPDFPVAVKR